MSDTLECPKCKYNLRGLESNRCPECGATFRIIAPDAMPPKAGIAAAGQMISGAMLIIAATVLFAAAIAIDKLPQTAFISGLIGLIGAFLLLAGTARRD